MIHFQCPRCGFSADVPDERAGKKVRCPKCTTTAEVPVPNPAPKSNPESAEKPAAASDEASLGKLSCPFCSKVISESVRLAGQKVLCPNCNSQFDAPETRESVKKANSFAATVAAISTLALIALGILQMMRGCAFLEIAR